MSYAKRLPKITNFVSIKMNLVLNFLGKNMNFVSMCQKHETKMFCYSYLSINCQHISNI